MNQRLTIKDIITRIVYDKRENPEDYLIAFKKNADSIILIPLTLLDFNLKLGVFCLKDSIYPMHRIIGIKHRNKGWILLRKISAPITSYSEDIPNFLINYDFLTMYDEFDVQRLFPYICNRLLDSIALGHEDNSIELVFNIEFIKIYLYKKGGILYNSLVIENTHDQSIHFIRSIPSDLPNLRDYIHKLNVFHRLSFFEKEKFRCSDIYLYLPQKPESLVRINLSDADITLVKNNIVKDKKPLALFYNNSKELIEIFNIEECRFLGRSEREAFIRKHNINNTIKPILDNLTKLEISYILNTYQDIFVAEIFDNDIIFLGT